jgi:hypothetical protein
MIRMQMILFLIDSHFHNPIRVTCVTCTCKQQKKNLSVNECRTELFRSQRISSFSSISAFKNFDNAHLLPTFCSKSPILLKTQELHAVFVQGIQDAEWTMSDLEYYTAVHEVTTGLNTGFIKKESNGCLADGHERWCVLLTEHEKRISEDHKVLR